KVVRLAVLVGREYERAERDQHQDAVAQDVLQLDLGAVDNEADAGAPIRRGEDRSDDASDEEQVDAAAHRQVQRQSRFPDRRYQAILAVVANIDRDEDHEHEARHENGFAPELPGGPEEIDAVQKADEQRPAPPPPQPPPPHTHPTRA